MYHKFEKKSFKNLLLKSSFKDLHNLINHLQTTRNLRSSKKSFAPLIINGPVFPVTEKKLDRQIFDQCRVASATPLRDRSQLSRRRSKSESKREAVNGRKSLQLFPMIENMMLLRPRPGTTGTRSYKSFSA